MYRWKSKNYGPVLLKWLFCRTETVNVNGQDGNGLQLKTSGRFFQVFAHVPQIESVKTDFGYFFFLSVKIHLILFP